MSLARELKLSDSPFEHYAAETEPKISLYAIRPPYLETISTRAFKLNSFILFGDRGAGKSATRITIYNDMWSEGEFSGNKDRPFTVNITDFSQILETFQNKKLKDIDIAGLVAFFVIEQALVWLSSLESAEREVFIEALDKDEKTLSLALIQGFYLNVPEMSRDVSTGNALKLLNSAWTTKSAVWINKRWTSLSHIVATAVAGLSKKYVNEDVNIAPAAEKILASLKGEDANVSRAVLSKLVEFVQMFGFSGICLLVDKVDETPITANSAEESAKLIHPVLNHIQLLEVEGCSWIFFLWSNLQKHFNEKFPVRLDKIAHTTIKWEIARLREMIETRVKFFSDGRLGVADLFEEGHDVEATFTQLVSLSIKSPRELIKILDTIVREHDAADKGGLLNQESVSGGADKYVVETIETWYPRKHLQQVLRLGMVSFNNSDVLGKFKISGQGARAKIKFWEDLGLVAQDGTMASAKGNKPVNKYIVADTRVIRIIDRKLNDIVGADVDGEII